MAPTARRHAAGSRPSRSDLGRVGAFASRTTRKCWCSRRRWVWRCRRGRYVGAFAGHELGGDQARFMGQRHPAWTRSRSPSLRSTCATWVLTGFSPSRPVQPTADRARADEPTAPVFDACDSAFRGAGDGRWFARRAGTSSTTPGGWTGYSGAWRSRAPAVAGPAARRARARRRGSGRRRGCGESVESPRGDAIIAAWCRRLGRRLARRSP